MLLGPINERRTTPRSRTLVGSTNTFKPYTPMKHLKLNERYIYNWTGI
jgi:hypothetical protein